MADLFVWRTTAFLLFTSAVVCFADTPNNKIENILQAKSLNSTQSPVPLQRWEKEYRIPTETYPVHYDLYLHPDLESGSFSGKVAIQVSVNSPMPFLVTHSKDLNITNTLLKSLDNQTLVVLEETFEYKPNEFWVLKPEEMLLKGNYSLEIEFTGSLEHKIKGFYRSVYTTSSGEKRSIATSQFQATNARAAFPCFDEPSFKSTFTTTLVRPSDGYIALSNMPQESESQDMPKNGLTEVKFEKSVPMVTYLACFIVCDFDYLETKTQDNKLFRVYATKDQINRANYAKDIGVNILNYFENYFEIEYPLPKQDMIAIPDFAAGAMEHWGLITYRETNLLYDDEGSSSYNKQRVATVISHELAHMWFGNLMTLLWWDDLWLNEGFASYIEFKGVAQYEKDWDMMGQFVILDLQPVFKLDSKLSSHPIVQPVAHPNQISELFDKISYSKGASVLRMLDNFMGEEPFRLGVRNFLREFKYSNAITSDLWRHLEETSTEKLPIGRIMDTWTKQMGFPVVNVVSAGFNEVEIRQKRFLQDPEGVSKDDSPYGYKWDIPITFKTDVSEKQQEWFFSDAESLTITLPSGFQWVKFNVDQFGYYRVNYDMKLWDQLIQLMKDNHEMLSPADRSSLLDDAFSLAGAGQLSYTVAFRLASYLDKETHYVPWKTVSSHLSDILDLLRTTKAYPLFRKYVLSLVESHASRVGWTDSGNHLEKRLRPLLLGLACKSGSSSCLGNAKMRINKWISDQNTAIPPNLRSVVYKYGMSEANYSDWQTMLHRYANELNAQEKSKMLSGLVSTNTQWIMHRFLDESRNETIVRSQDYLIGLIYASRNPSATGIVWEFVKSEWEYLVSRFTINSRYLGRTVGSIVSSFTTPYQIKDAKNFFASEPEAGSGARAREQALEEAQKNVDWLERHSETLYQWLVDNV